MHRIAPELLTTGEIARHCRVSVPTVLKWIANNTLPATKTPGGHHRVALEHLRAFLVEHGMHVPPELLAMHRARGTQVVLLDGDPASRSILGELLRTHQVVRVAATLHEACLEVGLGRPRVVVLSAYDILDDLLALCALITPCEELHHTRMVVVAHHDAHLALQALGGAGDRRLKRVVAVFGRPLEKQRFLHVVGRLVAGTYHPAVDVIPDAAQPSGAAAIGA